MSLSIIGGVLSPEAHDFSLDESFDSEDDSDHYDDYSSDAGNASSSDVSLATLALTTFTASSAITCYFFIKFPYCLKLKVK